MGSAVKMLVERADLSIYMSVGDPFWDLGGGVAYMGVWNLA
jgi:hypothetical protein